MRNQNNCLMAYLCAVLFLMTACTEDSEIFEASSIDDETTLTTDDLTARTTVSGDKILDIDYSPALDKFIIAVDREDKVTLHYSLTTDKKHSVKHWWKYWEVASNAIPKGHPGATPFLGSAWDNNGYGMRVLKSDKDNYLKVLPGITKNGQPVFRGGSRSYRVGDLAELIDIDYVPANDIFVISGKTPDGVAQTYFCRGAANWNNWMMVPEKYGAGTIEAESSDVTELKGTAFGAADGTFIYAYTHQGLGDGLLVLQGRYHNGIPRLEGGSRAKVGDLVELVDIDYNANNTYYTITGWTASRELKTYYSLYTGGKSWKSWEVIARNRSASTTPGDYFGSAWSADGHFITGFIANRNNLPSVTRGFTHNGKPRFYAGRAPL